MPVELNRHTETILCAAVEISDPGQRTAYLDRACGDDAALRRDVARMVDDHFRAGMFLERPGSAVSATDLQSPTERPGTQIGRYKLLEQIGEGGMGVVYVAEQTEPVRRRVALKIIKPGMDTRQVIARFEAERQALAMMDHPNIARVHDGGTTDESSGSRQTSGAGTLAGDSSGSHQTSGTGTPAGDSSGSRQTSGTLASSATGRPYFVMELVRGMPITDYCDQARLNPRGRLELFMTVCHAVQHAHQKGIIHRDIKPTNVLVTMQDGQPVVKVIDFGVAKAVNQSLTERTVYTAFTELIGTPLYMSPEQAELTSLDVDTRSDVYSLGVLLYELLTGQTPFDRDALVNAGLDEIRRMIREDEPPRPSHRISTLKADAGSTVGQHRGIDQRQLTRVLTGELDWIVMKALEKDRNRRYESASAFAADIERHLNNEPVEACPPSALYRFRKFARRRHGVLVTITLIALAVLVGVGGSLWQAAEANDQRENALAHLNVAHGILDLIREEVAGELARIPRASRLQRKILEESLKFYDQLIESDPDDSLIQFSRAVTATSLSKVYLSTLDDALRAKGLDLLQQAVSVQESLCENDPNNLQKLRQLGFGYREYAEWLEQAQNNGRSAFRLSLLTKEVNIFQRLASSEPKNERAQLEYAISLGNLAIYRLDANGLNPAEKDTAQAVSLTKQAIQIVEGLASGELPNKDCMLVLAQCYIVLGLSFDNKSGAEQYYHKALDMRELLLKDEPTDAFLRAAASAANERIADFLREQGRLDEEEPFFRRAVDLAGAILDEFPDSPFRLNLVALHRQRLGFYEQKGMWREAVATYPHFLKHCRWLWEHQPTFWIGATYREGSFEYANLLYELDDKDAARESYRETLRVARQMLTPIPAGADNAESSTRIPPINIYSQRLTSVVQDRDAKTWLWSIESTCPFPELCQHDRAQPDRALSELSRSVESLGALGPWLKRAEFRLRTGDPRGALADFELSNQRAKEIEPKRGADPYFIVRQAMCHDLLGEFDEGTKLYENAAAVSQKDEWTRERCMRQLFGLATDCWKMGRQDEARRMWRAAIERTRLSFDSVPSDVVRIYLGVAHYRLGNFETSVEHFVASIDYDRRRTAPGDRFHDGNSGHFYALAMNYASMGQKEEAHRWFELARQWDKKHLSALDASDRAAKRAIHQEAAELLGISDEQEKAETTIRPAKG